MACGNGLDYVFGLPGNRVLQRLVEETADDIRTRRALDQNTETRYKARSWKTERRACACIEATTLGSTPVYPPEKVSNPA